MAAVTAVLTRHPALPQFPHLTTVKESLKALPMCVLQGVYGAGTNRREDSHRPAVGIDVPHTRGDRAFQPDIAGLK